MTVLTHHRPWPDVTQRSDTRIAPVRATRSRDPWRSGEPALSDVMADPIVALVMRRDGLEPRDVWPLMLDAGGRLRGCLCRRSGLAA